MALSVDGGPVDVSRYRDTFGDRAVGVVGRCLVEEAVGVYYVEVVVEVDRILRC